VGRHRPATARVSIAAPRTPRAPLPPTARLGPTSIRAMFSVKREALEVVASWLLATPVPSSEHPLAANIAGRELVAFALCMQMQQKLSLLGRAALHGVRAHAALSAQRRERLGMLRSEAQCPPALYWRQAFLREQVRRQQLERVIGRPQRALADIGEQLSYVRELTANQSIYVQVAELCEMYERCNRAVSRFARLHPEFAGELDDLQSSEGEDVIAEDF